MSQHDDRQTDLNIAFARSDWKDKDMSEPTPRTDYNLRGLVIPTPFVEFTCLLERELAASRAAEQTLREEVERLRADKDEAYSERNNVVAALARLFPSGIRKTEIEGWNPEWHGCVYIDLPNGQISYHYHDSQAPLFAGLPAYTKEWDGHDKATVHLRLATFNVLRDERAVQAEARAESVWREGMLEAAGICEAKAMLNWATGARDCAAAIREKINSQQKASKK